MKLDAVGANAEARQIMHEKDGSPTGHVRKLSRGHMTWTLRVHNFHETHKTGLLSHQQLSLSKH
jgi:hypothetical protein